MRVAIVCVLAVACSAHRREPVSGVVLASQMRAKDGTVVGMGGQGPKGKFLCEPETEVGSHIPKRVCRYVDDDADSRQHLQETRDAMDAVETGVCLPNGGTCAGSRFTAGSGGGK